MRSPKRGEIHRLKSDPVGKPRPVLIVSRSTLNGGVNVLAAPFYSSPDTLRKCAGKGYCVFFATGQFGLEKDCVLKADEVQLFKIHELRTISPPDVLHTVDAAKMAEVSAALRYALDCEPVE